MKTKLTTGLVILLFWCLLPGSLIHAQSRHDMAYDTAMIGGLQYRNVGPFRGGRSTAVAGYNDDPFTFLMGTTGGGIWKTTDAGNTWNNISDAYFGGSIGAVAVAESDPSVIYVGTGSACIRGNTSAGHGLYKSDDGGKTWNFIGLPDAGQVGKIIVHPKNADLVYVAALGHAFGSNEERGVFRSKDGGKNWEHVLALSDTTGAVSLTINPHNPREIYAGMWRAERKPWTLISGGNQSGVYKTTDGGDTWKKLGGGLPTGLVGKVAVTVSPANPDRVWAILEAEPDGGVYRSDDGGHTWMRTNSENKLRQRAWYYTHIMADPQDPNTVYALNTGLYRSVDGGKTFENIEVPHGDVHDLWISPSNPEVMVVADDGGAQVSLNGGKTWSSYLNQPTAELYAVTVDNGFPYRLYGAQQDNTTITVPSWSSNNILHPKQLWYSVGGCETGPVALHPDNPSVIYAGCYGGVMDRYNLEKDQVTNIMAYPQLQLGEAAKNLKYRFQWVSPMAVSLHDGNEIYHGSQHVMQSKDAGKTWREMSPDLTTNTPEHLEYSGGPINHDITGVEIYNTVFEIAVSPQTKGEVWAGTDDGRLHLTRDDGSNWTEITPPGLPKYATIDRIDLSVHQPGRALVAAQKYRFDDFAPYIFVTNDYGKTWKKITTGIPGNYPVRSVCEDPEKKGLLFAGTEFGVFVSFNDGAEWQSLQLNLPITPVTDLRVNQQDLVLSTQGRSFWILDDITPLHQITPEVAKANLHLFKPRVAYRVNAAGSGGMAGNEVPERKPQGATIYFKSSQEASAELTMSIVDKEGRIVKRYSSDAKNAKKYKTPVLPKDAGMHRVNWDLTYEGPTFVEGTVIWGYSGGVKAPPGTYEVRLTYNGETKTQQIELKGDPRLPEIPLEDYEEQLRVGLEIRDAINEVHQVIGEIQDIKKQVTWISEQTDDGELTELAKYIREKLSGYEDMMMQTKNQSGQDPIRFAPRLDNQLVELYNYVTGVDGYISGGPEGRPKEAAYERKEDVEGEWKDLKGEVQEAIIETIDSFNELVKKKNLPAINRRKP
ncbi:MAG: glycosyl hydrolase [Saprospiraceae bacterium]|nr:glycosyl hydrolase [Saprospiraceae bacterium]